MFELSQNIYSLPFKMSMTLSRPPMTSTIAFTTGILSFSTQLQNSRLSLATITANRRRFSLSTRKHSSCSSKRNSLRMRIHSHEHERLRFNRESFLQVAAYAAFCILPLPREVLAEAQFSSYKGPISLGFSFSYPSSWEVTKKAIKTHLSEVIVSSKDEPSTTAGVVVDAVKIDTIDKFGTPETVGQKVIYAEGKKDSVKSAGLLSATAATRDGLTYYIIDYTVDSTRGLKRYIAKATVTGNQLYVFTTQAKIDSFQGETGEVFARMLDSFIVMKQYS